MIFSKSKQKHQSAVITRRSKNVWRFRFIVVAVVLGISLFALATSPRPRISSAQQSQDRISDLALQQIQALVDEKESRTPTQRKIDSQLLYAMKMARGESIARGVSNLSVNVGAKSDGTVTVDISAGIDDQLLAALSGMGVMYSYVFPQYHMLRAVASLQQLESIASLPQVRFIQPEQGMLVNQKSDSEDVTRVESRESRADVVRERLTNLITTNAFQNGVKATSVTPGMGLAGVGSAASQADTTHRAYSARGTFNVDGTGIRIGVISNGVVNMASAQASGDLPPTCSSLTPPATEKCINVVPGQTGSLDEGTAMLELIHDVAPGAQLYFATANPTITQFANNITALRNTYNCDIIVDDVGYFVESPFQDGQTGAVISNTNGGIVTQAVNDAVASGALYFSSAANSGNKNDGTSGTWEGDFVSGGTMVLVPGGNVLDFDPTAGVAQSNILTAGGGNPIGLYWSDPLGGSSNDYDLFVLNNTGTTVVASSTNLQNGTQDPYEQTVDGTFNVTNNRIVVLQKTGAADRFIHLTTNRGRLNFSTEGETHGHNAASGAYGVAAVCAACNFPPVQFTAANTVETFSSDGPRKIFYNANSTPITPGNVSSTGGSTLQQPMLTAADGASVTGAGGFSTPFFGTSAAAPHAAAIAALLKDFNPAFTKAQITSFLSTTSLDIETAGTDRDAGFGIIMPYPALQAAGATGMAFLEVGGVAVTETCCNSNGLVEPGEAGTMTITLNNTGLLSATGITATLSSSTLGVNVFGNSSGYSNLVASTGSGTNSTPFRFSLPISASPDPVVNFTLTINYTNGWAPSQVYDFSVQLGRQPIVTTLDTTAPATSSSYPTTSTVLQTNRVFRDGVQSTCGGAKPYPGTSGGSNLRADTYTLTNITGVTQCVKVTLTPIQLSAVMHYVAYLGSYNPASVSTNYLGDAGSSPAGLSQNSFFVNVPAGQTLVVVVNELSTGGGVGTSYILQVAGLPETAAPTAVTGSISGAITDRDGNPLGGVAMRLEGASAATTITDSNGRYRFEDLAIDNLYTVTPSLANYQFAPASRSFSLLGNRTDAVFTGSPESVVTANAIDSTEYFVRQQYLDFLGREPDDGGFRYWTDQINRCGSDANCIRQRRLDVSAAFFDSAEFQQTGSFVYRLYKGTLGRQLSYDEFAAGRGQVVAGANLEASKQAFVDAFVARDEFVARYQGQTSGSSFVDAVLDTLSASGVDLSSERENLISKYGQGQSLNESRSLVLRELGDNAAFSQAVYNRGFVLMEYFAYLRRDPDQGGYDFWLNVLNNGQAANYRGMVCAFISSGEYQLRFGPRITRTDSECAGL